MGRGGAGTPLPIFDNTMPSIACKQFFFNEIQTAACSGASRLGQASVFNRLRLAGLLFTCFSRWAPQRLCRRSNCYNAAMPEYTEEHARSGIGAPLPAIETWPNQYPGYTITIEFPEFTSVCPKTGLPDFANVVIEYLPDKLCLEMKSLKMYLLGYRNLGIFTENAVNRILEDVVAACRPVSATVTGKFTARGGMSSTIVARWPK